MMDESFLTTEEVLEYLQVNLRTVYRLIKAGKIPAVRVGRQWRFRKRDIDAWLETPASARRRARRRRRRPGRQPTASGGRPRVLVVDDEATIRDLLSKTLALAEYDVDMAPDGRTALERLRIIAYDLLITDLKMPGVDGLTVIREARRLKADLPVIIITGFSNEASAIEAVNLGVSGLSHETVPRSACARRRLQSARRVESAIGNRVIWKCTIPAVPHSRFPIDPALPYRNRSAIACCSTLSPGRSTIASASA